VEEKPVTFDPVVPDVYYVFQRDGGGDNEVIVTIEVTQLDVPHVSHHIEIGPQIARVRKRYRFGNKHYGHVAVSYLVSKRFVFR